MTTIWFVDDDEEMSQAISLMLGLMEYEMRHFAEARLGAQALMEEHHPDLLMLDISMPEVTGLDLLEFVRRHEQWNDLPILMLSSEAVDAQIDRALGLGADGFVGKPATMEELEAAIQSALKKRHPPTGDDPDQDSI